MGVLQGFPKCYIDILATTLEGFVEVEAEVSEDDPQLLPPVRVLKLPDDDDEDNDDFERYNDDDDYDKRPEEITGQLVLKSSLVVDDRHAG